MKNLRVLIVVVVLVNVAALTWLLLRRPADGPGTTAGVGEVLADVAGDGAMEASRYDLSDRKGELNVVVISLDALRYDRTGIAGNTRGLTPNLDRFAQEAVVFTDATTAAPWTLPAHMSVWTGRWPSVHGVTNKLKLLGSDKMVEQSLSGGIETFPDRLIAQGYVAGGFTGGAGVQGRYGFGRNFDTYLDDRYFGGMDYSVPVALEWLKAHRDQRFFLFLHGYDSHGQYPLPEAQIAGLSYEGTLAGTIEENAELREGGLKAIDNPGEASDLSDKLSPADSAFLSDLYDQKVKNADERLGQFMAAAKQMGLYDDSIIVVMSDHGDEFMERGAIDHGHTLYQEQVHTVLMVRFPGYAREHRIDQPVRTIDVFPTVFDAMGLEGPTGVNGQSMLPLLRGQPWSQKVFSETDYRLFVHQRMIRDGQYKLILDLLDGKKELYNLEADPQEREDLSSTDPRRTYEMEQELRTWMEAMGQNPQDYLGVRQDPITIF